MYGTVFAISPSSKLNMSMVSIPATELELLEEDNEGDVGEGDSAVTATTSLGTRVGCPICKSLWPVTGNDELEEEEGKFSQHANGASPSAAMWGQTAS